MSQWRNTDRVTHKKHVYTPKADRLRYRREPLGPPWAPLPPSPKAPPRPPGGPAHRYRERPPKDPAPGYQRPPNRPPRVNRRRVV
jgi:hypothetical protein